MVVLSWVVEAPDGRRVRSTAAVLTNSPFELWQESDVDGSHRIHVADGLLAYVMILPAEPGFAQHYLSGRAAFEQTRIVLEELKNPACAWWHECLNLALVDDEDDDEAAEEWRKKPMRLAVLDTDFGELPANVPLLSIEGKPVERAQERRAGHGAHVMHLLLGALDAAAVTVDVVAIDIADRGAVTPDQISSAMLWLVEASQVDLINLSWGAFEPEPVELSDNFKGLKTALGRLQKRGALCIAAAGNRPHSPCNVAVPACAESCVAVGAVGHVTSVVSDGGPLTRYCANEATLKNAAQAVFGGHHVYSWCGNPTGCDVLAPGVGVVVGMPGIPLAFDVFGTSYAAPLVTAALTKALTPFSSFRRMERGPERHKRAWSVLKGMCGKHAHFPVPDCARAARRAQLRRS